MCGWCSISQQYPTISEDRRPFLEMQLDIESRVHNFNRSRQQLLPRVSISKRPYRDDNEASIKRWFPLTSLHSSQAPISGEVNPQWIKEVDGDGHLKELFRVDGCTDSHRFEFVSSSSTTTTERVASKEAVNDERLSTLSKIYKSNYQIYTHWKRK